MNKLTEKIRKLLFGTSWRRLLLGIFIVIAACVMAYYAQAVVFYNMPTDSTAYTMEFAVVGSLPEKAAVDIRYDGDVIRLLTDADVDPSTVRVYAATRFGAAILTAENMAAMDETFLGTFAAVCPKRSFDVDGDGQNENRFYTVKTDLRAGQSKSGETVLFREENIPMEMGMDSFEKLFVYYQSKPLLEREVTVYLADGSVVPCTTDARGYLNMDFDLKQIRAGVAVEYAPMRGLCPVGDHLPGGAKI